VIIALTGLTMLVAALAVLTVVMGR